LFLVERQAERGQAFFEGHQHLPRIRCVPEAHHEVVGVAHDRDQTARVPPAPLMHPEIEHVVQEDVGQ
jgi:hypothetical protein